MDILPTPLDGLRVVQSALHADERGVFTELWREAAFAEAGIGPGFVQNNRSLSRAGVLRGLHFQWPAEQGKLVRVDHGAIFDVAVDIRPGSPTYGRWHAEELSAENGRQMWVPPGFAHGFLSLEEAVVGYLCTGYYVPGDARAIAWDDPEIGIAWPLPRGQSPILSATDAAAPTLAAWAAAHP